MKLARLRKKQRLCLRKSTTAHILFCKLPFHARVKLIFSQDPPANPAIGPLEPSPCPVLRYTQQVAAKPSVLHCIKVSRPCGQTEGAWVRQRQTRSPRASVGLRGEGWSEAGKGTDPAATRNQLSCPNPNQSKCPPGF